MYNNNNQKYFKTLVLGGSGKIGSTIRHYIGDDNCDFPKRSVVDLSKPDEISNSLDWGNYGAIIYCAGISGRQVLEVECKYSEALNIKSPAIIAQIAAQKKLRFCYISSDDVFDGSTLQPYSEYDNTNPLNRYGQEKRQAEIAILELNPRAVITRLPMVYGGAISQLRHVQFLDKIISSALENTGSWTVSRSCVTNPSCLDDVLPKVLDLVLKTQESGLFHICNSKGLSLFEFASEITALLQSKTNIHGVHDTFSTPDYQKKGYAPLITNRHPSLRSCKAALRAYLGKRAQTRTF